MGTHPANLLLRFLLELAALIAMGFWGWKQGEGIYRYILALGIPLLLAAAWGTFAVPDDPSRSGAAPVVTPGIIRLILELAFFGFATWALYAIQQPRLSLALGLLIVLHYGLSYDRILWLLRQ